MSPLNPDAPPPTRTQRATLAAQKAAYRYRRALPTLLAAAVYGLVLILTGIPAALAAAGVVAFLFGAYIHALGK